MRINPYITSIQLFTFKQPVESGSRFKLFPLVQLSLLLGLLLFSGFASGQAESTQDVSIEANVDLVSRYIWRGTDIGHSPSVQPALSASWKDFTLGAWGAYKLSGVGEAETDFYLSKSFGFVNLSVWDYWSFNDTIQANFFDYRKHTTAHLLEAQLLLSGGEALPFNFLTSCFFYGADESKSIYLELQFEHQLKDVELLAFAGYQAKGDYYAENAGFVNIGCTLKKSIAITDRFAIPLSISLITNPALKNSWLVAAISF